jgi:hypothetical protein
MGNTIRASDSDFHIFLQIKARLIRDTKQDWSNLDVFNFIVSEIWFKMSAAEGLKKVKDIEEE